MATYSQLIEHIGKVYQFVGQTCWIAHVKEKHGLTRGFAPNRYSAKIRVKRCPPETEAAIEWPEPRSSASPSAIRQSIPFKMLVWSALLNRIVAVPIIAVVMVVVTRPSVMGRFSAKPVLRFFGWAGTALMVGTVVALIWSSFG
jgi:hypothetical protein